MKAAWALAAAVALGITGWLSAGNSPRDPCRLEAERFEALLTGVIAPEDLEAPAVDAALARDLGTLPPQIVTTALEVVEHEGARVRARLHWNADRDGEDSGTLEITGVRDGDLWSWSRDPS